ncbi:MAG: polyprenyl synthetase family protein [Clostridia bacterium]|nr:polyprenyl synthetase family protein [Clostridia bacterium]
MVFKDKFDMYLSKFENYIEKYLDELKKNQVDDNLFESMKYSLTSKGKRIRPIIMMAFYELCGGKSPEILKFALAIEMVHTYSLIHDDLPAMDNDTMRRGKPCNHVKFGEDIALLAGDALLTNAFELISSVNESEIESSKIVKAIGILSQRAGAFGMVSGQAMDLQQDISKISKDDILKIYNLKTANLISASAEMGAVAADTNDAYLSAAKNYGKNVGLCFQIIDDILDKESENIQKFGGIKEAKDYALKLSNQAKNSLEIFEGDSKFLSELADSLSSRLY